MKQKNQKPYTRTLHKTHLTPTRVLGCLACAAALPMTVANVHADAANAASGASSAPPASNATAPAPSAPKTDMLFNLDVANQYVTPRGMMVRNQGVTFQPLILGFVNAYGGGDGFINSVTLVGGMWNDIGTSDVSINGSPHSSPGTAWTEIDPIGGFSVGFLKNFTLDVTATAFVEQIEDIGTSAHMDFKLSYNDTSVINLDGFGFHPYVEFWQEVSGKATDAQLPDKLYKEGYYNVAPSNQKYLAPGESFYIQTGIDPTYVLKNGIKLEAPVDFLLPNQRFYGQYYGPSSTLGIWSVGGKVTVPMNFMPEGYGHWGFHFGAKYMYFEDNNLYNLNYFNDPGHPVRNTCLLYAGVSVFF